MTVWIESPFDSLPVEGYRKQRYWLMAEAFVRAGHSVVYWTSDFSHANKRVRECLGGLEGLGGLELVMVPTRPYPRNVCWERVVSHREYARTWARMAEERVAAGKTRPDVIVVSSPPVSTGPAAVRLARQFGARLVVDVQDAWPETFYRLLPQGFRWVAWLLLTGMRRNVGATYRTADLVTGVCDRYAELVKGYGAKTYYRAYLGMGEREQGTGNREQGGMGERERGTGDREQGVRVAYVGNLGTSYDLKTVVAAVELLNRRGVRTTLDVAGFGGVVETGASVRFHGMLSQEKLRVLLARCDVGIIPMTDDSFVGIPNKLAEYAAAGLRVVSSLKGETEALLAKYGCGVTYRAGDVGSLTEAILSARELPDEASRRLVREELAAERIYDGYVGKVEELVN